MNNTGLGEGKSGVIQYRDKIINGYFHKYGDHIFVDEQNIIYIRISNIDVYDKTVPNEIGWYTYKELENYDPSKDETL